MSANERSRSKNRLSIARDYLEYMRHRLEDQNRHLSRRDIVADLSKALHFINQAQKETLHDWLMKFTSAHNLTPDDILGHIPTEESCPICGGSLALAAKETQCPPATSDPLNYLSTTANEKTMPGSTSAVTYLPAPGTATATGSSQGSSSGPTGTSPSPTTPSNPAVRFKSGSEPEVEALLSKYPHFRTILSLPSKPSSKSSENPAPAPETPGSPKNPLTPPAKHG
jgi:hypothetical protein